MVVQHNFKKFILCTYLTIWFSIGRLHKTTFIVFHLLINLPLHVTVIQSMWNLQKVLGNIHMKVDNSHCGASGTALSI